MTATPLPPVKDGPASVERGSGETAWHCAFCGAHKPVPSMAYLCEMRHLAADAVAA